MLHMENGKEFWTYVASLFLFGTNGVVAAHIIGMGSTQIVMFRTLLGALVLTAVFLLLGRRFTLFENPRHAAMLILSFLSRRVCMNHRKFRFIISFIRCSSGSLPGRISLSKQVCR